MTERPFTRAERDYLERSKEVLDGAFQAFLITAGFLALPFGFLAFTLTGRGGWSGDRLSTALAGFIMLALIAGVVYYSALGRQEVRFDRAAFKQRRALGMDLHDDQAVEERLTVTGKEQKTLPGSHADGPRRQLFVVAGGRRFQLSPMRWMALGEGETVAIAYARHSAMVLSVDGQPDRIRLPKKQEPDLEGTPIGGG